LHFAAARLCACVVSGLQDVMTKRQATVGDRPRAPSPPKLLSHINSDDVDDDNWDDEIRSVGYIASILVSDSNHAA